MPDLTFTPPTASLATPAVQRIELIIDRKPAAVATWCVPNAADGVVQILSINVDISYARKGHGSRLVDTLVAQARSHLKSKGSTLRRLWGAVEQKAQVNARAFLTRHGFHHVGTVQELSNDQDLLIYMKTFD